MKTNKYIQKTAQYAALQDKLDKMGKELDEMRLEILRRISMKKTEKSIILTHGKRSIKAVYNEDRGVYALQESGKRIATIRSSIHDIRFQIAMGTI